MEDMEDAAQRNRCVTLVHVEAAPRGRLAKPSSGFTDGPHKNPGLVSYAQSELDKVQRLEISQADKDRMLGGNIAELLNL